MSVSNEIVCGKLYIANEPITKIRLIEFAENKGKYYEYIECFLVFKKQLIYS